MTEDTDAAAPPGSDVDGPAPAEEHAEAPSPAPTDQVEAGEGEEAEPEAPEEVEFDFGGNKLRVPKGSIPDEIAEQLDRFTKGTWRDYTTKSQEIAEARKAVEAERSVVQKLSDLRGEALTAYSQGLQLRSEIEQLQKVDLASVWQSDPDRARQISDALSAKQAAFQRTVAQVGEYETRATAEEQQHVARLTEEGRSKVLKLAKGFDEAAVVDYAIKTYGISEEQARQWPLNPAGAVMAWKAMQYDRLQAKAVPAAKPPAPPTTPVKAISGRSAPAAKEPDKMSDDEWVRWRNSQLAKRRA